MKCPKCGESNLFKETTCVEIHEATLGEERGKCVHKHTKSVVYCATCDWKGSQSDLEKFYGFVKN
jgi:hypothetical protein